MCPCFRFSVAHNRIPTPGKFIKKVRRITDLNSPECYTGLGFSFCGEFGGRASLECAFRSSSADVPRRSPG